MSSRGQFVGKGPTSGQYQPRPVPQEAEGMPSYINDELLQLGGQVNELFQGGGFPATPKLPEVWIDGRMLYFNPAPDDIYEYGPYKGQRVITNAGVWQYKVITRDPVTQKPTDFKWVKLIDDPTDIVGGTFIYLLTLDGNPPNTPPTGPDLPPAGWSLEPPLKNQKSDWIWVSTLAANIDGNLSWTVPTVWSAGVVDGLQPEMRYIAFGDSPEPDVANPNARDPETTGGDPYLLSIPPTTGSQPFVYSIQASVDPDTDQIVIPWSDPVKFATPETTQLNRSWATASNWGDPYPPFTPTAPGLPGPGWEAWVDGNFPPTGNDQPVWMTERLEWPDGTSQTVWSTPVQWNNEDGVDGAPGVSGDLYETWYIESAGNPGVPSNNYPPTGGWQSTTPSNPSLPVWSSFIRRNEETSQVFYPWSFPLQLTGDEGIRGTIAVTTTGTSWSNQVAWDTIVANTVGQNPNQPIPWDTVTINSDVAGFVESRRYVSGSEPGTWSVVDLVVDGDAVITGTLHGNKIISNTITATQISAGTITGNEINAGSEITIGGLGGQDTVILSATDPNARIWVGNLNSSSANFAVDPNGNMYANSATFAGNISSTATITGGTLQSAQINSANGNFIVNTAGDMTCNNATINGTLAGSFLGDVGAQPGAKLVGPELHIPSVISEPTGEFTGFHVYSNGKAYIGSDAVVRGNVYADKFIGDVVSKVEKTTTAWNVSYNPGQGDNTDESIVTFSTNTAVPYNRKVLFSAPPVTVGIDPSGSRTGNWEVRLYNNTDGGNWLVRSGNYSVSSGSNQDLILSEMLIDIPELTVPNRESYPARVTNYDLRFQSTVDAGNSGVLQLSQDSEMHVMELFRESLELS